MVKSSLWSLQSDAISTKVGEALGCGSQWWVLKPLLGRWPRSSKLIYEDNDYALYSVTLFKRVADSFKQAARSKGFQVLPL